jgi:hypothetical protein
MEFKTEPKPEVIFIKTETLTADNKNGKVIVIDVLVGGERVKE